LGNCTIPYAYQYNYHMNTLHQLNPTAAAYLCNIPSQFWVAAFIPGRRYGQDTSERIKGFQLLDYYKRSGIKL